MNIIELAKEAGFTGCLLPEEADDLIGGVFIDDENWIKPLERFAALVRAEREWADLTDYEIVRLYAESPMCDSEMIDFARAVIAAWKEKNK